MSGREWVVDAYGCDAAALADLAKLRALFARLKVFEAQVRAALILAEAEIAAGLALKELQRFGMDARVARRHHAPALGARLAAPVRHHAARRFDDRN